MRIPGSLFYPGANPFILILTKKGKPFYPLPFFPNMFKIFILLLGFYLLLSLKCLILLTLSPFPKNKNRPQKQVFSSCFQGLFLAFILFLGTMPFAPCRIFGFALKYGDTTLHIYYIGLPPTMARPKILLHFTSFFQ